MPIIKDRNKDRILNFQFYKRSSLSGDLDVWWVELRGFQFYKRSSGGILSLKSTYLLPLLAFNSIRDLQAKEAIAKAFNELYFQFYKRSSKVTGKWI